MEKFEGNPIPVGGSGNSHEKKMEPVTSDVTVKNGSLAKKFFAQDLKSTGKNILNETIIPAAKRTISDMVKRAIDFLLYGTYSTGSNGYTDYRGITTRTVSSLSSPVSPIGGGAYAPRENYNKPASNNVSAINDFVFNNRADAEEVLYQLQRAIHDFGCVSVGDFYDSISQEPNFTDYKWGWKNLDRASVQRLPSDRYRIVFPPVIALE